MLTSKRIIFSLAAAAVLVASACAKKDESASPASTPASSSISAPGAAVADVTHGKALFVQNCAVCHGAGGISGGVGPSLKNERSRKTRVGVVAQIKNPQPPMPKLYPGTLSEHDVADLASYVETL